MKIYVNYNDRRWRKYKLDFERIAKSAVDRAERDTEASITLTNDSEIHQLNKQYRGIDKPTNVLSFELGDDILMGDIYISLDTVIREAKDANISVAEHTAHMVVHGMLHLQGYDHITDNQAKIMESKEIEILDKNGIKNPYETTTKNCTDKSCCPGGRFIKFIQKMKSYSWFKIFALMIFGLISACGFAPFNLWYLTIIGIGGAYLITQNTKKPSVWRSFLNVFPFSAVYAISMFWWTLHSIYVLPELTQQLAIWTVPALIGIGIGGGIIFSIPFVFTTKACASSSARPFIFAGSWAFTLWLREWFLTGFPWNPVANIVLPYTNISNSMSLWGALGLTFIIIGLISSIAEVLRKRTSVSNWLTLTIFVLLFISGGIYGHHNVNLSQTQQNISPVIRLIQPAQSASQKASHSRISALQNAEHNIKTLTALSTQSTVPEIIVFPETAYPFTIIEDDFIPMAQTLGTNIILGTTSFKDNSLYNSMAIVNKNGNIENIYNKSHLVPFGEYRPFGDIIPTPGQLTSGDGPTSMNIKLGNGQTFNFAPAICYEIIFSDSLVLPNTPNIDAIVNITNDTWFGETPGTYQHLDMVRRYAIESGLPIIRANYSGISGFILPNGELLSSLPVGVSGFLDGIVWGAHETPYRKMGRDLIMIIILLGSIFGTIISGLPARKKHS